jgi:glycosyltransferase involved in cell wall biosynthesis
LAERGHRVTCYFDLPDSERRNGSGPALPAKEFERLQSARVRLRFVPLTSLRAKMRFRRDLQVERPDVIHTHKNRALKFFYSSTIGMKRPPWVANRGTIYPLSRHRIGKWIHHHSVQRIVAVSKAVAEALIEDDFPEERIRVVYGSLDPERFDPSIDGQTMRVRWGVAKDVPLMGILASLTTPKKGHRNLLVALGLLGNRIPDLHLICIGEGDPNVLQNEAKRLGVANRVHFSGFVEDAPQALAALDVVVCSSVGGEGLTGAVREGLAMARSVVSTDVAGNCELVEHGRTGFLAPTGDPESLAETIASAFANPERSHEMARAGREKVLQMCTDGDRAAKVEAVYREILPRSSGSGAS